MRVFVTGATGFIGSAVVQDLLAAGHGVLGLARSDRGAAALKDAGAEVWRGALDDPEGLAEAAAGAEGVIHLAFTHDFTDMAAAGAADLRAVEAIGAALAGSGRPFVVTSGTLTVPLGRLAKETDAADPDSFGVHRVASEEAALALAARGVRSSVVRLPPTVHGPGDHGFVPAVIATARDKGVSAYVGEGANRWPAVHRLDAARLFRLAVEAAPAGVRLHGAAEEGVPFRGLAEVIARGLDVPLAALAPQEALAHFGWLGAVAAADNPVSAAATRELLGWTPGHPGLLADVAASGYFD